MDVSTIIIAAITWNDIQPWVERILTVGLTALVTWYKSKPKEKAVIKNIDVKSQVLLDKQQLEENKFNLEQLDNLEQNYLTIQQENKELRQLVLSLTNKLDESDRSCKEALTTITFLKIELKAKEVKIASHTNSNQQTQ